MAKPLRVGGTGGNRTRSGIGGGYDYLLKIVAPSIAWYQALMDQLLEDDIGIEKFASRIILRQPLDQGGYPLSTIANGKPSWD